MQPVPGRVVLVRGVRRGLVGSGEPVVIFSSMSGDLAVRRPRRLATMPSAPEAAPSPAPLAEDEQMAVLRALERGEIGVEEATRRLAGGEPDA